MERGLRAGTAWAISGAVAMVLCLVAVVAWAVVPAGSRAVVVAPNDRRPAATSVAAPPPDVAGVVTGGPPLATLAAGLSVRAAVAANGTVLVNEQLTWSTAELPPNLVLNMEPVVTGPGIPTGTRGTPDVSGFQVELDGQVIAIPYTTTENGLRTWTVPTTSALGSHHVLLVRYLLTGARVTSNPAPTGRATIVLEPFLTSLVGNLPAQLSVRGSAGAKLRGVNCPVAPVSEIVCGSQRADGWVVSFPAGSAAGLRRVTVQTDLP